jgi:hypothetical protein
MDRLQLIGRRGPLARHLADLAVAGAILVMALLQLRTILALPVHHDIAWPLTIARALRGGARLYADIIEVHPPLVIFLAAAANRLGDVLHVTDATAYHLLAFGAALVSLALSAQLWPRALPRGADHERRVLLLVQAFLLFPFVGYNFGQEEHLVFALGLPYLLAAIATAEGQPPGRAQRCLVGLLGGFGFAFKPLYALMWLAIELALLTGRGRRGWLRAETILAAAVLALYAGTVLLLAPEYVRLARWGAAVYPYFHPTPFRRVLLSADTGLAVVSLLVGGLVARAGRLRRPRLLVAAALAASVLVVYLQGKGWAYHWYPTQGLAVLLLALTGFDLLARLQTGAIGRVLRPSLAVALLGALLLLGSVESAAAQRAHWARLDTAPYYLPQMTGLVQRYGGDGPIAAFTTTMQITFPLVNRTGVPWGLRFSCLWPLPGLYHGAHASGNAFPYHSPAEMGDFERFFVNAIAADLARSRPSLLIVDRYPPEPGLEGFRYLAYFLRDPRIRATLADYRLLGTFAHRYDVFQRPPAARPAQ